MGLQIECNSIKEVFIDYGSEVMALVQQGKLNGLAKLTDDFHSELIAKIREVVEGAELTDGEIERSRTFGLHGESMPAIHVEAIARVMKWTILKAMEEVE
ncbi:hypothetical protein LCGC14_2063750 [marine sediment metagenome]|uniref:Uncharacterized protein n=1 Tax=marine sediment metagenome TaxID=412755 RepID=A0A0F9EKI9_9ZZZZ